MSEKLLRMIMSLLLIAVFVVSAITVNGEQKDIMSYYAVHVPEAEMDWGIVIPAEEGTKYFYKAHCTVPDYVINIGGGLVDSNNDDYWEFDGGTTYVMDRDFTYEGTMQIRIEYCYDVDSQMWITVMRFDRHGVFTFTETETSIHAIDGTLEFYGRSEANFSTSSGVFIASEMVVNGHGTGDLKGVMLSATDGPKVFTPQTGNQWTAHEGTISGWPTHLNKPLPQADIYIDHTYCGDLIVEIGVGDPSHPIWSQRIWEGKRGDYMQDLDLTVELSGPTTYSPPDSIQWYLEVYDRFELDEGQITEFSITYGGITYTSTDTPVPIYDKEKSYAYIPSG